jgi:Flp pilus assembly pilin Flp
MSLRGIYMKHVTTTLKSLWNDESGQGATEYILLLVVVVGVAFLFKGKIMEILTSKLGELGTSIGSFTSGSPN